jgi:hypothetical protein
VQILNIPQNSGKLVTGILQIRINAILSDIPPPSLSYLCPDFKGNVQKAGYARYWMLGTQVEYLTSGGYCVDA